MKTAISLPDTLYSQVETKVRELGTTRSHFWRQAVERYLRELEEADLVAQINQAYDLETARSEEETRQFLAAGAASSNSRLAGDKW